MNLEDLAEWLNEMEAVVPGCRIELMAYGSKGVVMTFRWSDGEKVMSLQYAIGSRMMELSCMAEDSQKQVLEMIRVRVENSINEQRTQAAQRDACCASGLLNS